MSKKDFFDDLGMCYIEGARNFGSDFWNNQFRKVSYEILSQGRQLADEIHGELIAVVMGDGIDAMALGLGDGAVRPARPYNRREPRR